MRILPLMFHGDIGKGIDDASTDPDRDGTETQLVEPLPTGRQRIFPNQHAAVITKHPVRPADFVDHLPLRHRDRQVVELRFRFDDGVRDATAEEQGGNQRKNEDAGACEPKPRFSRWLRHRVESNTPGGNVAMLVNNHNGRCLVGVQKDRLFFTRPTPAVIFHPPSPPIALQSFSRDASFRGRPQRGFAYGREVHDAPDKARHVCDAREMVSGPCPVSAQCPRARCARFKAR